MIYYWYYCCFSIRSLFISLLFWFRTPKEWSRDSFRVNMTSACVKQKKTKNCRWFRYFKWRSQIVPRHDTPSHSTMLMAWLYQWRHHLGALTAVVAALYNFSNESNFDCSALLRAARLILACYCISTVTFGGWRFLWIVCRTLRRDVRGILVFVKMKLAIRKRVNNRENIPTLWNQTLQRFGDKTCFYFEDQKWSFRDVSCSLRGSPGYEFLTINVTDASFRSHAWC